MNWRRLLSIVLLLLCPLIAISQKRDFEIQDFHENPMNIKGRNKASRIKGLYGKPAALIRFAVRDSLFEVVAYDGNLGVERETGELLVFVPSGTKYLTIRHPFLGIYRDYKLPEVLESLKTYEAEIVITNPDYLRKIYGYEPQRPPINDVPVPETHDDLFVGVPSVEKPLSEKVPKVKTPRAPIETHFQIGAGFNTFNVMGPSASLGFEIGKFFIGADYVFGIEKVEGVGIYYKQSDQTALGEAYDYKASRASFRIGGNFSPEAFVQLIPQAGVSINMITGDSQANGKKSNTQFEKVNALSAFAALSVRIKLDKTFCLHITPQYDFPIGKNDAYKIIKDADKKIKVWGEGVGINAGVLLRF